MNKPVLVGVGAVIVVGGTFFGAVAWSGNAIQTRYQQQIDELQTRLPFVKVVENTYDKKFFSSTATLGLQFGCPNPAAALGDTAKPATPPATPFVLTIRDHIQHGPLPGWTAIGAASADTELVLTEDQRKELDKMFGDQHALSAHTVFAFNGGFSSHLTSPAGKYTDSKGTLIAWQGLNATMAVEGDRSINFDFAMPGLGVTEAGANGSDFQIVNLGAHGQIRPVNQTYWLSVGKSSAGIDRIEVKVGSQAASAGGLSGAPFKLTLEKIASTSESSIANDLLSTNSVVTGAGSFNDTRIDKVELQASFKRLHAPTYQRVIENMMKSSFSCDPAHQANPMAELATLQDDLKAFLPYDPEYAVDKLVVETGGKRGEFSYSLVVKGVSQADLAAPPANLFMTKGVIKAAIKIPSVWIEKVMAAAPDAAQGKLPPPEIVNNLLAQVVAQGYVVRDGEYLSSNFSANNGAFLVNGKPLGAAKQ